MAKNTSLDPGEDWVPDVTMLRRMYLDGYDADGNPWPPPLGDDLCQALNDSRAEKQLLDVVPIIGEPISKTPETKNNTVLCMLYAVENVHATRIRAIRKTWAPACDGFLVFSTKSDSRIPAISIPHRGREEYRNMWQKIRSIWKFVGKHYLLDFDWFYIGGDDLVAFPQNLKKHLGTYNSSQPFFVGRRFKPKPAKEDFGFNTGGAGYALSRPSLQCMLDHIEEPVCRPKTKTSQEDVMTAKCLEKACNITYSDTRDEQNRERFHHFDPKVEYTYKGKSWWYTKYIRAWPILLGKDCCAPDTVNFHYIKSPAMVRYLFHYVQTCNRQVSVTEV